jgi:hypothetical protein
VRERWRDLPEALPHLVPGDPVRVHFHVPLHWSPEGGQLRTTVSEVHELLAAIAAAHPVPHLEVETYTWAVLPEPLRPRDDATLIDGIVREIRFVEEALQRLGAVRE